MFGAFGVGKILAQREAAKTAPTREVTLDEFIKLASAAGMDRPEFHGKIARSMGASLLVNGEMLSISIDRAGR